MKRKNNLILEFTEFNLQRMSPDSAAQAVGGVDDPSLSTNALIHPIDFAFEFGIPLSLPAVTHFLLWNDKRVLFLSFMIISRLQLRRK